MPRYALGIDIGGTFTDIVVYDHESGSQVNRKVLTTHDDPSRAVAAGVAGVFADGGLEPGHVARVVHATTLFTNALIERKGAVTGLITTAGFADTLEIGRERKYELYDINVEKPAPLVPRQSSPRGQGAHARGRQRARAPATGPRWSPAPRNSSAPGWPPSPSSSCTRTSIRPTRWRRSASSASASRIFT